MLRNKEEGAKIPFPPFLHSNRFQYPPHLVAEGGIVSIPMHSRMRSKKLEVTFKVIFPLILVSTYIGIH